MLVTKICLLGNL